MGNESLSIRTVQADLEDPNHSAAVVELVDAYARDAMGGGNPLSTEVRRALVPGLRAHPTTLVFLAYDRQKAVGIAVCFIGYSTFAAKPLINVHDLAVRESHRRQGVGRLLLEHVATTARRLGCCKVTLEVREDNLPAQGLYRDLGFIDGGLFWTKPLG